MSERLTLSDFAPHVRTRFRVSQFQGMELELSEITDTSNGQLEQFSLIFTSMLSPWLQQGLYKLSHPCMSECELFLVPIGPDETGMRYQAVFSRITGAADGKLSQKS